MNARGNVLFTALRSYCAKPQTNQHIACTVRNRNPRNLERLRLAWKPTGKPLDDDLVEYWHKLQLNVSSVGVTALLTHNTGKVVVSASTSEWALRKFLYSPVDTQAYIILGRVFAQRCFESGIISCESDVIYKPGSKAEIFLKELLREGFLLEEAKHFSVHDKWYKVREKRPWTVLEP